MSVLPLVMLVEVAFSPALPQRPCAIIEQPSASRVLLDCSEAATKAPPVQAQTQTEADTPAPPTVEAPAPAVAVAATKPLPPRINTRKIWSAIESLKASDAALRNELRAKAPDELTPEERALVQQLSGVPNLTTTLRRLPADAMVMTNSLSATEQKAVRELLATESLLEQYVGRSWLDWMIVVSIILTIVALGVLFYLRRWVKRQVALFVDAIPQILQKLALLDQRVTNVESRFEVKVEKILEDGPQRTYLPEELRAMSAQRTFDYYLKVDGQVARYPTTVFSRTENDRDVLLVNEFITRGTTSKKFHKAMADSIERNGGIHPHAGLKVVA